MLGIFQNLQRLISSILLISITVSCATITSRKQYISINSNPTSVPIKVRDTIDLLFSDEPEQKGVTPFFLKIDRSAGISVMYPTETTKGITRAKCGIRWTDMTLGNGLIPLLIFPTAPAVAIGGFIISAGMDLLSGSAYECQDQMIDNFARKPLTSFRCPKVLIYAPPSFIEEDRKHIVDRIKKYKKKLGMTCLSTSEFDFTKGYAAKYRLLEQDPDDFLELSPKVINHIGFETQSDFIAFASIKKTEKKPRIRLDIVDLHKKERVGKYLIDASTRIKERSFTHRVWDFIQNNLSLLPNHIRWSGFSESVKIENTNRDEIASGRPLNPFIPNLRIGNIKHPDLFQIWDYSFDFTTSYGFNRLVFTVNDSYITRNRDMDFLLLNATINFNMTVYTPFGSLGAAFGGGLGWFNPQPRFASKRINKWQRISRFYLTYRYFPLEDFFFSVENEVLQTATPFVDTDQFELKVINLTAVGIGYFLGDFRTLL